MSIHFNHIISKFFPWWRNFIKITKNYWFIFISIAIILFFTICYINFGNWNWTGFFPYETITPSGSKQYYAGKNLWDALSLMIVPVVLAFVANLFNKRERETEQFIVQEQTEETALNNYLDRMTEILLEREKSSPTLDLDKNAQTIARARTLSTVRRLNGDRKASVIQFLFEAGLIDNSKAMINLMGANLNNLRFSYADVNLQGVNLSGTFLNEADFKGMNLAQSDLSRTDLLGADFREAKLDGVNLALAHYSSKTKWPKGFNPKEKGVILVQS